MTSNTEPKQKVNCQLCQQPTRFTKGKHWCDECWNLESQLEILKRKGEEYARIWLERKLKEVDD